MRLGLWFTAFAVTSPLVGAHPLLFVLLTTVPLDGLTRQVATNTHELTSEARLAWLVGAIMIHLAFTSTTGLVAYLRRVPPERYLMARTAAHACNIVLVPLALLVLFAPFEGNIVGFFYFPCYLLGALIAVIASVLAQIQLFQGRARPREGGR
jgi:hypothetical protein